jgi:hypothetical protein
LPSALYLVILLVTINLCLSPRVYLNQVFPLYSRIYCFAFKTLSPQTAPNLAPSIASAPVSTPHNCLSCGITSCFRSQVPDRSIQARTGYLVDDHWMEFDRYIQTVRTERDRLYLPIDGRKFRKQNYSWNTTGFDNHYALQRANAIVLPTWVEHQPRRLLQATFRTSIFAQRVIYQNSTFQRSS